MLQFKAPWSSSPADSIYKFSINTQQHKTLETGLARRYPDAVFYVLPLFIKWSKVYAYAPSLTKAPGYFVSKTSTPPRSGYPRCGTD